MSDDEAQYWAQMQAEAEAHEAENAAAQAAEYEAAMEAEQARQVLKPFRAWVAWSPTGGFYKYESGLNHQLVIPLFIKPEKVNMADTCMNWRFVEVEVREVGSV